MEFIRVEDWGELDLSHMIDAYRKAKADTFFERSIHISEEFALFEGNLHNNLLKILERLKNYQIDDLLLENPGEVFALPKTLGFGDGANVYSEHQSGHSYFSDSFRSFEANRAARQPIPEFRLSGRFSVTAHIISALWINLVGHRFDEKLSPAAFGSRLRRYGEVSDRKRRTGYHVEATGSFEPYFHPYREWRDKGFQKIEQSLSNDESVIAITLDFKSYYHNIKPDFILNPSFLSDNMIALNSFEHDFCRSIIGFLKDWSDRAFEFSRSMGAELTYGPGLPIGLSAVRIISNVLLLHFDQQIRRQLMPVYYGRYVDDIFLVIADPESIGTSHELWKYIIDKSAGLFSESDENGRDIRVNLPKSYGNYANLLLQRTKQKFFFLKGTSGKDLLKSIASEIRSLSSERRFLPLPDHLERTKSARVLAAAEQTADEAVSLRRADGLTIRRLGWALQLRSIEILARTLDPSTWKSKRVDFYTFAQDHIIRADKILQHFDHLPRLLSLAVHLGDWKEALGIVKGSYSALNRLAHITENNPFKLNGEEQPISHALLWSDLRQSMTSALQDAVLRSIPFNTQSGRPVDFDKEGLDLLDLIELFDTPGDIQSRAIRIRESDLAKVSYKEHLRYEANRQRPPRPHETTLLAALGRRGEDLDEFLILTAHADPAGAARVRSQARAKNQDNYGSVIPFIAPTRPYNSAEVALFAPDLCVFGNPDNATRNWAKYLRAVRGNWANTSLEAPPHISSRANFDDNGPNPGIPIDGPDAGGGSSPIAEPPLRAVLDPGKKQDRILLGITSLMTSDHSWSSAAFGVPDLGADRYERITEIVNLAIAAKPRPTHLLLPELALPERWVQEFAASLTDAGISLIAGLDYKIDSLDGSICSSATMVLRDSRLGYTNSVEIRQIKTKPAPDEEFQLQHKFGKNWKIFANFSRKPIYAHGEFEFGVLVCSELQDIRYRSNFRGEVDSLFVLSWNKDLETFSALVESASLDVHAYVALVNNRSYGDSRVRVPAKNNFGRDVCRLRGGLNEHLVVVEIFPEKLRKFQSRSKNWSQSSDPFKPVPEGFEISPSRKTTPA